MGVAFRVIVIFLASLRAFLWDVICLFYVFVWGIRSPIRQALTTSAGIVLLTSSLVFFAEVIALFHQDFLNHAALVPAADGESWVAWMQQILIDVSSVPWIKAVVEFLKHLLWVKLLIVLFGAWMVWHRWKEMKQHQRASVFAGSMRGLFEDMASMRINPIAGATTELIERNNIEKTLIAFGGVFTPRTQIRFSILRPSGVDADRLGMTQQWPKQDGDPDNFELLKGQGCAGSAFSNNAAIYVPAVRFEYGIVLSKLVKENHNGTESHFLKKSDELTGKIYGRTNKLRSSKQPFRSIISLPIRNTDDPQTIRAILNLYSAKQNAFGLFEQEVALAAASAIAAIFAETDVTTATVLKP